MQTVKNKPKLYINSEVNSNFSVAHQKTLA